MIAKCDEIYYKNNKDRIPVSEKNEDKRKLKININDKYFLLHKLGNIPEE